MSKRLLGSTKSRTFPTDYRGAKSKFLPEGLDFLKGKRFAAVVEVAFPGVEVQTLVEMTPKVLKSLYRKIDALQRKNDALSEDNVRLETNAEIDAARLERTVQVRLQLEQQTKVNDELRRSISAARTNISGPMKVPSTVMAEQAHQMTSPYGYGERQTKR